MKPEKIQFNYSWCQSAHLHQVGGLERVTGIEPAQLAWKARTLPLSYTRMCLANLARRNGHIFTFLHRNRQEIMLSLYHMVNKRLGIVPYFGLIMHDNDMRAVIMRHEIIKILV